MTPCQEQHQRPHTDDADGWRPLAQRLGMAIDELVQHVVRKRALDKLESRLEWERGAG